MSDPVISARSRLGGRIRLGSAPELIEEARRELVTAKLERAINEALTSTPPPSPEACERLAMVLLKRSQS